jgi:nucleotide-binding universal stress UspA family protein
MAVIAAIDLQVDGQAWLIERAATFARLAGERLHLVYVHDDAGTWTPPLEALLQQVPAPQRGKARVVPGDPETQLVELTRNAVALVVGPREPDGLERWMQGPMSARIIRRALCPVYVPRTARLGDHRPRLIAATDLHGARRDTLLDYVTSWTLRLGATLDLAYAVPRGVPPIRRADLAVAAAREWAKAHEADRDALQALLDARLPEPHRGRAILSTGEPEDMLLRASKDHDLIAVGNGDRPGLSRLLLGSVARRIVREAKCDVLVIPTATTESREDAPRARHPSSATSAGSTSPPPTPSRSRTSTRPCAGGPPRRSTWAATTTTS